MSYSPSERPNLPRGILEAEIAAVSAPQPAPRAALPLRELVPFSPRVDAGAAPTTLIEDELGRVPPSAAQRSSPAAPVDASTALSVEL